MKSISCYLILSFVLLGRTFATNTTSVFSPEITPGSKSLEYRFSAVDQDGDDPWAHRIHYQQAINDAWRWRLIAAFADPVDDNHEYRYSRGELQWQYLESEVAGWDAALRFELQIADGDDEPSRARVAWTGKWDFDGGLQLRANVLTGREFGSASSDGWLFETRSQVSYPISEKSRIGIEMFNDFNDTDDFGSYSEQEHQVGPIFKTKFGGDVKLLTSLMFGVSRSAADYDFRIHLTKAF